MKTDHARRAVLTITATTLALLSITAVGCAATESDEQNYRELQRSPTLFDPELDPLRILPDDEPGLAPMRPRRDGDGPLLLLVQSLTPVLSESASEGRDSGHERVTR